MATYKKKFFKIEFRPNETLIDFADRFYHKAQILVGAGLIKDFDSKIAMEHKIKPYKKLQVAIIPAFNDRNCNTKGLVDYLQICATSIKIPMKAHREEKFRPSEPKSYKKNEF